MTDLSEHTFLKEYVQNQTGISNQLSHLAEISQFEQLQVNFAGRYHNTKHIIA